MRRKKNYAMVKLNVPKRVTLPNGRIFIARYKKIKKSELPPNIVMRRAAPRGRRRRRRLQQGEGIFHFVKKVAKNPLVRSIAKKGLEYAPGVYHNLTKRVKNKTLKRILKSDAGHLAKNKGLLNFQIDKFFKDKENEEIKKNYMGVYSMNKITRYITFYEKIKKKKKR